MASLWLVGIVALLGRAAVVQAASTVVINEILVSNASATLDPDFVNFGDWIELHNTTAASLAIRNYYLSDDPALPLKWRIPSTTPAIPAGGFLRIWADGEAATLTGLHTNFKLSGNGEVLVLSNASGVLVDQLDYTLAPQLPDISYGRQTDGAAVWAYFATPTPASSNNASPSVLDVTLKLSAPKPTLSPGFYTGSQLITFPASPSQIYYTLDGSAPTTASTLYTAPFSITSTTVVRARAYQTGYLPSRVESRTYFINQPTYSLPVISISTNPSYFFDNNIGIYVPGVNYNPSSPTTTGNYFMDWQRPLSVEYFTADGTYEFSFDGGVQIHGNATRSLRQKSLYLLTDNQYGSNAVNYQLFPRKDINSFKGFILRTSGGDQYATFFRDAMASRLVEGQMDIETQAYQPAIVFLNGQYWGLHNLREKVNEDYVEANTGYNANAVDMLEFRDSVIAGTNTHYKTFIYNFITNNSMAVQTNYDQVAQVVDIDEYMNYWLSEIYYANTDWPDNNIRFWRSQTGTKWRWILFDTDSGFDLAESGKYSYDSVEMVTTTPPTSEAAEWSTRVFRGLLANQGFRQEFLQRFAANLSITFEPARVNAIINEMQAVLAPEMPPHIAKWRDPSGWNGIQSMTDWQNAINVMHQFANLRRPYVYDDLDQHFDDVTGTINVTLDMDTAVGGNILVHEVPMTTPSLVGQFFPNIPLRLEAVPNPGYRFVEWRSGASTVSTAAQYIFTPTGATSMTAVFAALPPIVINEIHYNPSDAQGLDATYEFVELLNNSGSAVDLTGYSFQGLTYTFPAGTTIGAGEYIVVASTAATYSGNGYQVFQWAGGSLNNGGETLALLNGAGNTVDLVPYDNNPPWVQPPDGQGPTLSLINPNLDNALAPSWEPSYITGGTPGQPNVPVLYPVVINEIHYNPSDAQGIDDLFEFVELYNNSNNPINLSGYAITDGVVFTFPVGAQIAPLSFVLVAKTAATYAAAGCPVYQWSSGNLNNAGETVRIANASNQEIDLVAYGDSAPWPTLPDGFGPSLELRSANLNNGLASSWAASAAVGGSPCLINTQTPAAVALGQVQTATTVSRWLWAGGLLLVFTTALFWRRSHPVGL